jgi:hypothetical protein
MDTLQPYYPTWRDRLASMLMGDNRASPERRNFVQGLLGSSGLGDTGMSLVDATPLGGLLAAQGDAQRGNYGMAGVNAAMAAVPFGPELGGLLREGSALARPAAEAATPTASEIASFVNSKLNFDNPATSRGALDWLKNKQDYAEQAMRNANPKTATGKGLVGPTTAWGKDIDIPTSMLADLPGASNEVRVPGDPQYDDLLKTVQQEGWNPTNISVAINHKGQPYIYEGNTRVAIAKQLGIPTVPADISWANGGELANGPWAPNEFARRLLMLGQ